MTAISHDADSSFETVGFRPHTRSYILLDEGKGKRGKGETMADGDPMVLGRANQSDDTTLLNRGGATTRLAVSIINADGGGLRARATGSATGVRGDAIAGQGIHGISDSLIGVLGEARGDISSAEGVVGIGVTNNGVRGSSDSGPGVAGESTQSVGVAGISRSVEGVVGGATKSVGVRGASNTGFGVYGESKQGVGVKGAGPTYGVIGESGWTGVRGTGATAGVSGESPTGEGVRGTTTSGTGISGWANSGSGVYGFSAGQFGVFGNAPVGTGVRGDSITRTGVHGESTLQNGVAGQSAAGNGVSGTSTKVVGVRGEAPQVGVFGASNPGQRGPTVPRGVVGTSREGIGVVGASTQGWAAVFDGKAIVFGDFFVNGRKSAVVSHPDGSQRLTYCTEATECWFEDFGRARLKGGAASVEIDPDFAALIETDDYHVYLTPEGPTGSLYVDQRSPESFEVRTQGEDSSSATFSYRIVARRKDVPGGRLEVFDPPPAVSDKLVEEPFEAPEEEEHERPEVKPEPEPPRKLPRSFLPSK